MKSLRYLILVLCLLLVGCRYIPRQWSEQQIREIVRNEMKLKKLARLLNHGAWCNPANYCRKGFSND